MDNLSLSIKDYKKNKVIGKVTSSSGAIITAELPTVGIGDIVTIELPTGPVKAEVLSFKDYKVNLAPYSLIRGLVPGAKVTSNSFTEDIFLRNNIVGSLTDASGNVIIPARATSSIDLVGSYPININKSHLIHTETIQEPLWTGIPSIDTFTTIGKGQKLMLLAEPGLGKSSLLTSLCKHIQVDLIVIALIGERTREVIEFHQNLIKNDGDKRTIVVSATSDSSPLVKKQAALTSIRIAEIAKEKGLDVFLGFDSLTRYIRSIRDIGLAAEQLPIRRGYPASVFEEMPRYIERAGNFKTGSITALYTMLSAGDLDEDPLIEEIKGLTDGHIILSKNLAEQGIFPAIDIVKSLSRVADRFFTIEDQQIIRAIKNKYKSLNENKQLLILGGAEKKVEDNKILLEKFYNILQDRLVNIKEVSMRTKLLQELLSCLNDPNIRA